MLTTAVGAFRKRLLGVHRDHKRIARSALLLLCFVAAGKIVGASKEMTIAYRYGISGTVDAYQLAYTLVTWIPVTLTSELGRLLVPMLIKLQSDRAEKSRFLGELTGVAAALGIVLSVALCTLWPHLSPLIASNLAQATRDTARLMLLGMAPVGALVIVACIGSARLQACGNHVGTLLECIPALVLLSFLFASGDGASVLPLALGTSIGFLAQALALRALAKRADAMRAPTRLSLQSRQWPILLRAMTLLMLGAVIGNLSGPVDQYFLAQAGDGNVASLGYANRLISLLMSMGALAISRATLPVISEMLLHGDAGRARSTTLKWSLLMLVVGTFAAAFAYVAAPFAVALLFQRGAFTARDTVAVVGLFRAGLLQIPFSYACWVLIQLSVSEGRFRLISVIAVVGFVIKLIANVILVRLVGIHGVLLASGLAAAGVYIAYLLCTRQRG
ncbi:lipid II flippase MurJ [Caballeronia sp. Lep1P3]|uniref:lipid II flippase MurJ n=1 Tax=Caballeronia sp. Lep1P3 TaxID=2878150 RepID=UPI001FD3F8A7|nr:lipid II flippase MurJ [Caballeronia sp. Lep1P3]